MVPGSTLTTLPSVTIGASVGMAGEWVAVGLRFVSNQTRVHSLTENERLIQQFRLTPRICWNMNDHLVLITSFLDRCNVCSNRAHEEDLGRCKRATLGGYHIRKEGTANRIKGRLCSICSFSYQGRLLTLHLFQHCVQAVPSTRSRPETLSVRHDCGGDNCHQPDSGAKAVGNLFAQ